MQNYTPLEKDYEEAYKFIGLISKDWQSPPSSRKIPKSDSLETLEELNLKEIVEKTSVFRSPYITI